MWYDRGQLTHVSHMEPFAMPLVMPHLLYVSATDATATYSSFKTALRQANAGDYLLFGF
jgi:hypothetical protein